jgi:transcription elongation factor Elf1
MKKETIYKETEIFICENCGTSSEFESDVFICQQCGEEKCTTCSTREIVEREKLDELEKYPYKTICGECDAKIEK